MITGYLIYMKGLRPGQQILDQIGGLHKFSNWKHGLLTDSGGFQMVSLVKLSEVKEEGVQFQSPHDGSLMLLTPEKSIDLQNTIGADIIMQLDDVVSSLTTGPRVEEAMERSVRWLDRCIAAHKRPHDQNLFAIIQGGLDVNLRKRCLEEMIKRDTPGYAIGGLSGGEEKDQFWRMVDVSTDHLPKNKPRYCMGVGYALDLVVCAALGVDMFDCVFPTRTARFGNALTFEGSLNLRRKCFENDTKPIDSNCPCITCKTYSRAYLHTVATKEAVSSSLISIHNITFQMQLMKRVRDSIKEDQFPEFIRYFVKGMHPDGVVPVWAVNALNKVGVSLDGVFPEGLVTTSEIEAKNEEKH